MTNALKTAPALIAILLGSPLLGGCFSTATYGTGESPEMAILHEMTGNLGAKKKAKIEYQARAPLVMPGNSELPPPVQTASNSDPRWPDDPDKRAPGEADADGFDDARQQVTPEYAARLKPLAALRNSNAPSKGAAWDSDQPAYDIVGKGRSQAKEFNAALNEAEGYDASKRKYLTEPPLDARAPAATAPAQFDDIKKKRGSFLTRWFGG